ncbi:polysaccharide biosynthesis protein [Herbaspirillum rubrisubalbicans]|uniref:polysaccharide biosynthesis protein n=1 Tax=Herbaspirillum rubrisubalbicans TaxID=80842 RepID=UPI001558DC61|nr:nucleoside-diphosphate sugar epimerase/dehydratase [Herbaspirillum rubrisubalbicans]
MKSRVLELPRLNKQAIAASMDICLSIVATWIAFSLRLDTLHWPEGYQWHVYQLAPLLMLPIFVRLGLYRSVFRYTGIAAIVTIAKAVTLYGVVLFAVLVWLGLPGVPRSLGVLQPLLLLVMVGGSRAFARLWLSQADSSRPHLRQHRMLVYGAGQLGAQIAEAMERRHQLVLFGFLEDDPELFGKTINGRRVYAASEAASLIESYAITDILLALPSISRARRKEIIEKLRPFHVHIRSVPDFADVAQGKVTIADEHELDILDLLGRDPVLPNPALIGRNITNKVVMVTGAGGSIGSELCRQILDSGPSKLLLLDHNEYNLYTIHRDLQQLLARKGGNTELIPLLGSVRNYARVSQILRTWRPRTVYHAAAYKHVPLVEHNPVEGIINNVFGTYHVARAAIENHVSDYVLISTDKAVRPTNIMGASKRLAEMILQSLADSQAPRFLDQPAGAAGTPNTTRFSMVRFGNVLDSSGSVVPLFREQIKAGGPLTLTDPEVTRYFMLIPEAVQLVLQAGAMTEGGDVFVLDMGEPVKIRDLAYRMVELSGLTVRDENNPEGDIEIQTVGLRPGEKLYEELLIGESPERTAHPRIMTAHEVFIPWDRLSEKLAQLRVALDADDIDVIRALLHEVVNGYQPAAEIVDWSFIEKRRQAMQRQDGQASSRNFEVVSKP